MCVQQMNINTINKLYFLKYRHTYLFIYCIAMGNAQSLLPERLLMSHELHYATTI